jgi:DNA-binding transcriptional MerR regulator
MFSIFIKDLAKITGVSTRSLRYYEEKGLLVPQRLKNGYRAYTEADIERVRLIQLYISLGASTDEVAQFLDCLGVFHYQCADHAIEFYEEKLRNIQEQLEILKNTEQHLQSIISTWKKVKQSKSETRVNE